MRVFVTGATGFIGSAVVRELVGAGHEVVGLARSETSARTLIAAGARAHIGSFEDVDSLRKGAAGANGAIHLAFFHKISDPGFSTRLRIFLGGSPSGIVSRFLQSAVEAEKRAIEALGAVLTGDDRALVAALPTMALPQGRLATEEDAPHPQAPGYGRAPSEQAALALASRGIRGSVVRLAPAVHDPEKLGLVSRMIDIAKKNGVSAYVGDGRNRWSAVSRLDAAHLFRLALENGAAGSRYHAVAEEGIMVREIAESIGRQLNVPVVSQSSKQASKHFGFLAPFISADNPVSSQMSQELLGWHPTGPELISDIYDANVFRSSSPSSSPSSASTRKV
jgi:nucleoside-diphosphate-sugar epimerase